MNCSSICAKYSSVLVLNSFTTQFSWFYSPNWTFTYTDKVFLLLFFLSMASNFSNVFGFSAPQHSIIIHKQEVYMCMLYTHEITGFCLLKNSVWVLIRYGHSVLCIFFEWLLHALVLPIWSSLVRNAGLTQNYVCLRVFCCLFF